jgi:recombination protein RecA
MTGIATIKKRFGDEAIFRLGDTRTISVPVIPTGSLRVDSALGVGGIPLGRVTEIFGPESSGKTTLCQHIIANCQQMGGSAAFVDVENALDPAWAAQCGVYLDDLYVAQPDCGETALEIVELLLPEVNIIVVDSVAGLTPRAEIEGDMGASHMGLTARLMSQALRKMSTAIKEHNAAVIFTNQLRDKIGVVWGSPETTTGGRALQFWASVRIDLRVRGAIKEGEERVGNRVRVTIKKNKVAAPFKTTEIEVYYDEGISHLSDMIAYALDTGLVKKSGAWYRVEDTEQKYQGMINLRKALQENEKFLYFIEDDYRRFLNLPLRRIV